MNPRFIVLYVAPLLFGDMEIIRRVLSLNVSIANGRISQKEDTNPSVRLHRYYVYTPKENVSAGTRLDYVVL